MSHVSLECSNPQLVQDTGLGASMVIELWHPLLGCNPAGEHNRQLRAARLVKAAAPVNICLSWDWGRVGLS